MEQTQKPDMGEVIKSILQAEARAEEIAAQANAECRSIIADAEARAAVIRSECEDDVAEQLRRERERIGVETARQSALAEKEREGEKKRLADLAAANSEEAVKIILERLSGKHAG